MYLKVEWVNVPSLPHNEPLATTKNNRLKKLIGLIEASIFKDLAG